MPGQVRNLRVVGSTVKSGKVEDVIIEGLGGSSGGSSSIPPGAVISFAGSSAPTGWLLCDGTVHLIATYPALGALLGATYGGDGSTTFGVPDARGRTTVGVGTGSGGLTPRTLGQIGGAETHALSTGELATHSHSVSDPTHSHGTSDPGHLHSYNLGTVGGASSGLVSNLILLPGSFSGAINSASTGVSINSASTGVSINNAGSGTGHNNMQPFLALNTIIKT